MLTKDRLWFNFLSYCKVPSQKLLRPSDYVGLCRIWLDPVRFGRIRSDLGGFGNFWELVGFGQLWSDLVSFGRIWSALVEFGQISTLFFLLFTGIATGEAAIEADRNNHEAYKW